MMDDIQKEKMRQCDFELTDLMHNIAQDFKSFVDFDMSNSARVQILDILHSTCQTLNSKYLRLNEDIRAIFSDYQYFEISLLNANKFNEIGSVLSQIVHDIESMRLNIFVDFTDIFNEKTKSKPDKWIEEKVTNLYNTIGNYLSGVMKVMITISNRYSDILLSEDY